MNDSLSIKSELIKIPLYVSEGIYKEKGSSFIAFALPVWNVNGAAKELEIFRKKYYDAVHVCFAYKLFDGTIKYSDDGEPQGSAGIRILGAIEHFNLINTLAVVVRYFGGTKLGVGPLGKAYYQSAFTALSNAAIGNFSVYEKVKLQFSYDYLNVVFNLIHRFEGKEIEQSFENEYKITCYLTEFSAKKFIQLFNDVTKGTGRYELIGKKLIKVN